MTCAAYYETHPEPSDGDRCSNHEIEASTSRSVSLLGASTALFGILNLFYTSWTIKRFGIKSALLSSVFWPAIRLAVQNIGVMNGSDTGIRIIQASQIITILGGPSGYLLALNSYVAEIIEAKDRTGALGKLQGWSFIGIALAYLVGGLISDTFGILAPFQVTLGLFLISCLYVLILLPWLPISKAVESQTSSGLLKFFGPLKVFVPQRWVLHNGQIRTEYGNILLGVGVFLGVLATGYIPVLLQMYATDIYDFGATENGYLISLNSFIRGIFLTMVFPRIISAGRTCLTTPKLLKTESSESDPLISIDEAIPSLPHSPNDFAASGTGFGNTDEEPIEPPKLKLHRPEIEQETFAFDLLYARYSLLIDAILTGAATFVNQGWQLYLLGALLPFASGTGAAAKGTILQMCTASERPDALSAITLIDMGARLATTSVFGFIYSLLAEAGEIRLIFTCNAVSWFT
jgi:MFS family permease